MQSHITLKKHPQTCYTKHMTWKAPTNQSKQLYLPLSQNKSTPIIQCSISDALSVPISDNFLSNWLTPDLSTPDSTCHSLIVVLETLGQLIKKGQQKINVYEKTSPHDLVTDMDLGIERLIRQWFQTHLPTHKIIGEEGQNPQVSPTDIIWYLDPIDGTSNYAKNSENYCINLGSTYKNAPYINIVHLPSTGQTLFATPTTNNHPNITKYSPHLCSEFYPHKKTESQILDCIREKTNFPLHQTQAMGISLVHMIEGKLSYFYKPNVKPWDVMAPLGILAQNPYWDITLIQNKQELSPFSHSEPVINTLNKALSGNSRIGTIIVSPKSDPQTKAIINECIQAHV